MAGDHNGVVDVGAHLDGVHDQIAQEVQRAARDGRHRKVDPDASLDHHDQQHRQARRHKGEQQHQDHKKRTQHADQRVILHKAGGKVHSRGAVAHNVKIVRVIFSNDLVHLIQHGLGFVALLGQIEIHHHAGIVIALQLQLGFVQLVKQIVQILLGVIVQRNIALVHFPLDEPEHIIQGHLVVIQPVQDLAILALVGGVGRIQQLCHLVVNVHQLGKLARRNGIRQSVAVLCFHIGQALGAAHTVVAVQLLQYGAFIVVVPPGHDHRHQIFVAEGILNLVMGDLAFALLGGGQIRVGVHIGALVGKHRCHHRHHHKQRRNDKAGFYIKLSDRRDLGDQVFVLGGIDPAAEQHQKPGHQRKHREQAEQNCLDQHGGHINADAEMHKAQSRQTADGGQRAGGNFRNGLGQRRNAGLSGGLGFVLIAEAVAQDNGIVDGQRQLQHHGHRVGDKADLAAQKVGALVQNGGSAEGHHQNRDLGIGAAGECEHRHNDDGGHHNDHAHFLFQIRRGIHAHLRVHIGIVSRQRVAHLLHGLLADVIVLGAVKGHLKQGRGAGVVILLILELYAVHAVHIFDLVGQVQRHIIGDVVHHHLRRAVGDKVVVHHGQALPGLGVIGQIGGDVVFHLHPALGHYAKHNGENVQQEKQVSLIHDQRGQLFHAAAFFLFFVLHAFHSPLFMVFFSVLYHNFMLYFAFYWFVGASFGQGRKKHFSHPELYSLP